MVVMRQATRGINEMHELDLRSKFGIPKKSQPRRQFFLRFFSRFQEEELWRWSLPLKAMDRRELS